MNRTMGRAVGPSAPERAIGPGGGSGRSAEEPRVLPPSSERSRDPKELLIRRSWVRNPPRAYTYSPTVPRLWDELWDSPPDSPLSARLGRWFRRLLFTAATLAWSLFLFAAPVQGQASFDPLGDVDDWCIQRWWCDKPSHIALIAGSATALDLATDLEADETRYLGVAFYLGKELRDRLKWGRALAWENTVIDLTATATGWWLSGLVNDWLHGEN